ncbi:MAG: metal ABC transporter substrate-binding protein [Lachnospiraceae bacterium]
MLKKNIILSLVMIATLLMSLLAGCGSNNSANQSSEKGKKSVVCTIFPEYDWAKEVIGDLDDSYELTLLLDNGVDLHSYQPTAEDIAKIYTADLFIYVGGESDDWVEDALKEATNKDMQVINLLEVLGDSIKEEEVVEGMEAEEEHEHEEEKPEYDEHVWLSLKNSQVLVEAIADSLAIVDTEHADELQQNATTYNEKLDALDKEYEQAVAGGNKNTILFGDRFPFRYMVDDYNLDYYAAFVGCSAETEASFETIVFLAGKVDELGLSNIFIIENSDQKIATTISENTADKNQQILTMDSMQSTTSKDIEAGKTYLSIMESNLDVLKTALQ